MKRSTGLTAEPKLERSGMVVDVLFDGHERFPQEDHPFSCVVMDKARRCSS
jgi:hypothetical protein